MEVKEGFRFVSDIHLINHTIKMEITLDFSQSPRKDRIQYRMVTHYVRVKEDVRTQLKRKVHRYSISRDILQ
jgi:hypothetical protein